MSKIDVTALSDEHLSDLLERLRREHDRRFAGRVYDDLSEKVRLNIEDAAVQKIRIKPRIPDLPAADVPLMSQRVAKQMHDALERHLWDAAYRPMQWPSMVPVPLDALSHKPMPVPVEWTNGYGSPLPMLPVDSTLSPVTRGVQIDPASVARTVRPPFAWQPAPAASSWASNTPAALAHCPECGAETLRKSGRCDQHESRPR